MSGVQKIFTDNEGLLKIIGQHDANRHLLDCSRDHKLTSQNPMPYFRPHESLLHCVALNSERIIMAAASFRELRSGPFFYDESEPPKSAKIEIYSVNTHIDYRQRGLAQETLTDLFLRARENNAMLGIERFEADGQKWLTRILPRIHVNFPDVPVAYTSIGDRAVTAERPYRIVKGQYGALVIAYS